MTSMWQHPNVNLFKQFGVGQWKKCSKEGDVTSHMDRDIKATVYRISGSIPSSNYIQLPKSSSQSLNLIGRYLYVLFRPQPAKYFVVHVEVVTNQGMVIRISFSNLFKEFKSTSTWLQFPYSTSLVNKENHYESKSKSAERKDDKPSLHVRWTLLTLDLKSILSHYLHSSYSYLKNVKLCSSLLVKNVFTSDIEYSPLVSADEAKTPSGESISRYVHPLPREMTFMVTRGRSFAEAYDYIRFPPEAPAEQVRPVLAHAHLKGHNPGVMSIMEESSDNLEAQMNDLKLASSRKPSNGVGGGEKSGEHRRDALRSQTRKRSHVERSGAKENLIQVEKHHSSRPARSAQTRDRQFTSDGAMNEDGPRGKSDGYEEVHVYTERGAEVAVHRKAEESREDNTTAGTKAMAKRSIILRTGPKKPTFKSLEPDPIMKLSKVIGFGGHTTSQILFSGDCKSIVYPCHSLVVDMDISSGKQRFFIGHTDKVSCLSMNSDGSLLASGQTGSVSLVRVWRFSSAQCLALFKTHHSGLHTLSFSHSGGVLCGVGKDRHGKSQVVVWNTSRVAHSGEVCVLAKAHTDASIERMRVAAFDDSRMVSCGWDNIRFWRVRGGALRSCPVNLEEHHQLHFTDVMFQPGYHSDNDLTNRNVYACTKNGYLFEIHYKRIMVRRVWHLLPQSGGVAIHALHLHEAFCITGSEDGMLRVWPLDFSAVFMEAAHDGSVDAVSVSEDGLRILVGTSSGNIGLLDASSRCYTTLMRSHTDSVLSTSISKPQGQFVTCSSDHTIRVWDLALGTQLFDFRSTGDMPLCVSCHPTKPIFACGFKSGAVRMFHIPSTRVLAEHKVHTGGVTGLIFAPSGDNLYSSSSNGSLALYDCHDDEGCRVVRAMGNTVAKGERYGPKALSLSDDGSRLAFIGPMEFTVTVLDAHTMDELLRLDITPMASSGSSRLDPAHVVLFSPQALNQLLVITSGARLIKFNATNGQLLSEVSNIHRSECTSLAVDRTGRYLLTAGDKVVKVWDYSMALDLNFQVFIGHSASISQVQFTPSSGHVISCGDAIFIWEFLGLLHPLHPFHPSTPPPRHRITSLRSASPRKRPPAPVNYEPLKMQSFTPLAQHTLKTKSHVSGEESPSSPPSQPGESQHHPNTESDGHSYEPHSESEDDDRQSDEEMTERDSNEETESNNDNNINTLHDGGGEREGSNGSQGGEASESNSSSEEDVIVQQDADGGVEIVMKPKPPSAEQETPPPPYLPGSPSNYENNLQHEPKALKHCRPHQPHSSLAEQLYVAPPTQAGMERRRVLGLSGCGRNNVCWLPSTGLFVYSSGCIVVIEDLSNSKQLHLTGHIEEVSTLAVQHSGVAVASASPAFASSPCEIRVWKTSSGKCTKVLTSVHTHCIGCMAFSKDDRLLLSVGTYQDGNLAMWSSHDYSLLVATTLQSPVHAIAWDPHIAYEFTTVGGGGRGRSGVSFWMVEETKGGKEFNLKVHEPSIPADLLQTQPSSGLEFTSLCYGAHPTLFIGTNNGLITIWDTTENKCLLYWRTEPSEISMMVSSASQLVTGNVGGALQLWSVDHTHSPPSISMAKTMEVDGGIFSAAFDSKMELGVVGTSSGSVWYINWSDLSKIKLVSGHSGEICGISFAKDGAHFASCSLDGLLAVWSVESMEQIVAFQASRKSCTCLAFAPLQSRASIGDNKQEQGQSSPSAATIPDVVAGYSDGTVRIFDTTGVKMVRKMQPHAATVKAVMYSFDGHVIISGCADGVVAISNPTSGLVVRVISDHQGAPITDLQSSSNPLMLPSLGMESHPWLVASGDRRVSIWSSEWRRDNSCQLVDWLTFPGPSQAPDGTRLKKANKCQYDLLPPSLARFCPTDADVIVYTGYGLEKCVQFYSISRKMVFRTSYLTHWPTALDVSPHGHLLAFGCQERVLKLMDFEEGSFQDFTGHYDGINVVTFSPLGDMLISACRSTLHIWNITLQ